MAKKTVLILLADGFEEIEAVVCIDILRRAGLETITASLNKKRMVCGSHNIEIEADLKLSDFSGLPDALILPGGSVGTKNLSRSKKVLDLIEKCNEKGKIIAGICAAPAVVLSPLGILDNKKVTCYPELKNKLRSTTVYVDKKVVIDGNIITSQGVGTALYFALKLVEKLKGVKIADRIKQAIVFK